MPTPVTHTIADFVAGSGWTRLPQRVRNEMVRAWVNWIGCTLGGAHTETVRTAVNGISRFAKGDTPLLGRGERLDPVHAAAINCLASAAHTFDDTHLETITHPTGPIASVLLAIAHATPTAGTDLLHALYIGMEIECRVSAALAPSQGGAHGGWYMTGLSGGIGAAAAAGRVLGLDRAKLVSALGLAATQACGLRATHGSMAIAYVPAIAARNGLSAAYMAASGFTCSDIAIDGRNGLFEIIAPGKDAGAIVAKLGDHHEVLANAYKPYPCGIVIHPAIDACLEISRQAALRPDAVEKVDLHVHPDALRLTWRKLPQTALDAQVSLFHWVAAALVRGRAGLDEGEQACVDAADVRAIQHAMTATPDAALGNDQARVEVRLRDGRLLEARAGHALGSVANPMSDEQLSNKFRTQAARALPRSRIETLLATCWQAAAQEDIGSPFRTPLEEVRT